MPILPVNCFFCKKTFNRPSGRINEAVKFNWKQFCASKCLYASRSQSVTLDCERSGCRKKFSRSPAEISSHNYCSHSCAAIVSNKLHPRSPGVVKICATCGKNFKSRKKYCSTVCQHKGQEIPGPQIIRWIKNFYKGNGRIPLKNEYSHVHAARGRFGTWNKAIIAAGFDPNPVMFAKKYIAKDGHRCDSLAERIIDDWLSRRNIKHERSVPYPGNDGFTADFVVGSFWIEFFGLHGEHKRYDQLMKKKLRVVKRNGLKLISIFPKHLFPKGDLDNTLNALL